MEECTNFKSNGLLEKQGDDIVPEKHSGADRITSTKICGRLVSEYETQLCTATVVHYGNDHGGCANHVRILATEFYGAIRQQGFTSCKIAPCMLPAFPSTSICDAHYPHKAIRSTPSKSLISRL